MAEEEQSTISQGEESVPEQDNQQQPTLPKNIVTIEDAGPCKKKVSIEIPEQTIKSATDEQYESLRKDAVVPGFRKGRAPRRLLEKRFGKETSEQIKLKLLAEAGDSAIKDNELQTLGDPDIDFENIEMPAEGPLKFDFEVEVRPEFELPNLEGIPVTRTTLEVTDDQVEAEIERMRKWSGVWTPRKDGAVEANDQIIADALIKVEGTDEEQKLDNIEIHARPNGFVDAIPVETLDKLLIGAKVGDIKNTTVDVPKTYFREEYRGKKVNINIDIKDIKFLKLAELDESLLARLGFEDEKELREKTQDTLQNRLESQIQSEMAEQVYQYLFDNTDFDLPLDIVAQQSQSLLQRQYTNLMMRGLPREQLSEQIAQLQASSEEQAKKQLKIFFIMDKIAEKLGIDVSDEEINGHIAQLAIQRGQRPERMREEMERSGSLAQFTLEVRQNMCIAKMLETAQITEKKPEKKAKKAKKAAKTTKKSTKKLLKPGKNKPKRLKKAANSS